MSDRRTAILEELSTIFRSSFNNPNINLSEDSDSQSIEGWDSLANVKLLISIEKEMNLKFRASDITGLSNVAELISLIQRLQDES